jgi:hypothetical protein
MKTKTKTKHSGSKVKSTTKTTEDRKIFHVIVNSNLTQKQLDKFCEAIIESKVFEGDKFLVTPGNVEIRRIA